MTEHIRTLEQAIADNSDRMETVLAACFPPEEDSVPLLLEAEQYSLLGGGKRIRPFLVNEFCRLYGGDIQASVPFAAALEMIHCYSLIHDDLPCMDDDDMRRGKPSNHKQYGYANALLAGDALLTKAFETAATNTKVSCELSLEAVRVLAHCAGEEGMIAGQVMDLMGETEPLELEELLVLHSKKTGALMECAALLGCLAAGYQPDTKEAQAAALYARKIGVAFQVIDDVLDVVGDQDVLGKNVGTDEEHAKTTFLTYFDVDGARAYAENLTAEAVSALSDVAGSERLTDLAVYLLNRTH
ncbi:MAG: polyprenyl synthetase family protein [Clostridia bacterium]|nr:polyprenyl synthetase family protein [Clostridia bacterium]